MALAIAVGLVAFVLSVVGGHPPPAAPTRHYPHSGYAVLLDLCDDDDATQVLDGGMLEEEREHIGVDCRPNASARTTRYLLEHAGGGGSYYRADELLEARAVVQRENEAVADAARSPNPAEYFSSSSSTVKDGSCASHGLRDLDGWAERQDSIRVDLDGDGRLDRFAVYSMANERYTSGYPHLRVELASGPIIDHESKQWDELRGVFGVSDLNDDGMPEVWVDAGGNTAWNTGLAIFDDCKTWEVVRDGDFAFPWFLYSASGNSSMGVTVGVECTDVDGDGVREIVETEQQERIPEAAPFAQEEGWSYIAYRLDGRRAREVAHGAGRDLDTRPSMLRWSGGIDCGLVRS